MTRSSFKVDLHHGAWTSHVVCSGELDLCSVGALTAAFDRSLDRRSHTVIFNGAGATLFTTAALEVLVAAASRCRAEGVNFEVILGARSRRLVELLGAGDLFAASTAPRALQRDYEIPREVADALCDVMSEQELHEAFFGSPASTLVVRDGVTIS